MDATNELNDTAIPIKYPADAAGEYFAVELHADAQQPIETVSIEDALLGGIAGAEDFEESVRKALAAVGGELLFQMRLENVEDCRHVAAISLGSGEERRVALVILPPEGAMRIEPAESSTNPIAGIARSYVGLVDAYKAAA